MNSSNPEIGGVDKVKSAPHRDTNRFHSSPICRTSFHTDSGIWVNSYGRGEAWERPASVEMIGDKRAGRGGFEINCGLRLRGGFSRSGDNPKHALRLFFRSEYGALQTQLPALWQRGRVHL